MGGRVGGWVGGRRMWVDGKVRNAAGGWVGGWVGGWFTWVDGKVRKSRHVNHAFDEVTELGEMVSQPG